MIVNMFRGLWKPFVIGWLLWIPLLGVLLYLKIARGMPTMWYVPALIGLVLLAIIPSSLIFPLWVHRLQKRVIGAGGRICPNCLYDLRTLDDAALCPECGWDIVTEPPEDTWAKLINRGKPLDRPATSESTEAQPSSSSGSGDSPA